MLILCYIFGSYFLMTDYKLEYEHWKKQKLEDKDLVKELNSLKDDTSIRHNFRDELSFGTAGIRSKLGVGPKRLNIYVIRRATYGLAMWINETYPLVQHKSVSISYDSRIKSRLFAEEAARVLIDHGIHVYIYKQIMPTPLCSWAVRFHKSQAGIMITASHNPKEYNGFKVYGPDGGQLPPDSAQIVIDAINSYDVFNDIKNNNAYSIVDGDEVVGYFAFIIGEEKTYNILCILYFIIYQLNIFFRIY